MAEVATALAPRSAFSSSPEFAGIEPHISSWKRRGASIPDRFRHLIREAVRGEASPEERIGDLPATLGTLGLTSLLLTLVGYWAGRYGETTGRGRSHAPVLTALAATVFVGFGGYAVQSMLGEAVSVRIVLAALPAALIWNALLIYPVFGLVRRIVGTPDRVERAREVELLV